MQKTLFLKKMGLSALITGALFSITTAKDQKPNVLFILVDDLGWTDVKCNNPNSFYETPNIDKLASEGIRFTNGYASCPVCSPTRASLLTGKYPARLNLTDWITGNNPKGTKLLGPQDIHELPLKEVTLAETFKKNGYATGFFGKWHLGNESFYPDNQGFDLNKGGWHKGGPGKNGYYSPYGNPRLADGPDGEYLTDRLTNETIRFIENNKEQPFFAYLSFYTVHGPIEACKRHQKYFQKKKEILQTVGPAKRKEHDGITKLIQDNPAYASMVYAMDENVGKVLNKLKELKLDKNTIVIFTSDNGGLSTKPDKGKGCPTSNEPLRAGKGWCYEGGIRVPVIIKAPQVQSKIKVSDVPVTSTDFYPTLLDMAGIPLLPEQHSDGKSLVPLLKGKKEIDRHTLYWHYPHYHGSAWTPGAALRHGDWKLIVFYDKEKTELYNLKDDPSESYNLADKLPEKAADFTKELEKWQHSVNAQFPIPNPQYP